MNVNTQGVGGQAARLCSLIPCLLPQEQASREAVRDLDQTLFDAYIQRKSDPIVGSLEPGIYAGYFDWRDCQPPTGTPVKGLTAQDTTGVFSQ